jgi:tetratricopeptide (TPR) repeat protein
MAIQDSRLTKKMTCSFIKQINHIAHRLVVIGVFIFIFSMSQDIYAQQNCPPLTTGGAIPASQDIDVCLILQSLQRETFPIEKRNQLLIGVVQKRGIKFVQTEDEIQLFKGAGASDALIAAISKESAKLEKTSFGYEYLGRKYLDLGRRHRALEEKFSRAARESRQQNNTEEAVKNEEEARKNSEEAVRNLDKAASYDVAKKYDDAIVYFSQVIDKEPTASRYVNRGTIYEKKAQSIPSDRREERKATFDKAIEDYTKALFVDPTNTSALKYRADVYKFWGQNEKALEDYNEYLKLIPNNKDVIRARDEVLKRIEAAKNKPTSP